MEIRRLNEIGREDAAAYGLKAANLGELFRLGIAVPNGFVVPVERYSELD